MIFHLFRCRRTGPQLRRRLWSRRFASLASCPVEPAARHRSPSPESAQLPAGLVCDKRMAEAPDSDICGTLRIPRGGRRHA
jgi:hypothetical protein